MSDKASGTKKILTPLGGYIFLVKPTDRFSTGPTIVFGMQDPEDKRYAEMALDGSSVDQLISALEAMRDVAPQQRAHS